MRSCKVEKKNRVEGRPPLCFFAKTLDVPLKSSEPEERSEGHPHIMVCGSGEINFVSGLQAQTNRSKMTFHTRTRVNRATDVVRAQVVHGVRKRSESSRPWIQPEINKAALERDEWPNRPVAGYDFWPKQPVKHFEAAVCHRDLAARGHAVVGESLVEIVTHFAFQHDVRERFVAHTSSKSCHIRVRLGETEIVSVGANLEMILRRGQRDQPACEK